MKWHPYPEYQTVAAGWLNAVPSHWSCDRLRFHVEVNPTKSEMRNGANGTEVSFVPMEALGEYGGLDLSQTKPIDEVLSGYTYFRDEDVLVAKITPCFENGKGAIAADLLNGIGFGTTELHVLRPKAGGDVRFLFYLTITHAFRSGGASWMYGAGGQKRVPDDFIRNLRHPLPPLGEQRTIAAFLDRETVRIDALIARKQRQIELLQEKRQAVITQAVTRGLDPSAPMKNSGVTWIGEIPAHWMAERVKWVAKMESGHTPSRSVPEYWVNCTIPWISLADTSNLRADEYISETIYKINEAGLQNSSARILPPRAVVFTRDATVGLAAITTREMAVAQHLIAWLCGPHILPEYLLYVFRTMGQEFARLTMGSTIKTLGLPEVLALTTPVPSVEEQQAIVTFIRQQREQLESLEDAIGSSIERLREYRTALISATVTGKIDVRDASAVQQPSAPLPFRRTVLGAEIIQRLQDDPHFGRTKFEKALYLCEHHLGIDLEGTYRRKAAGPLDGRMLYGMEDKLARQKWYGVDESRGRVRYVPMEKAGAHKQYFERYWGRNREALDAFLTLFRRLHKERCEIVATLYAAWNDLLLAGGTFTDADILLEVRERWHERKERFAEDRLQRELGWMREQGLVPTGRGRPTITNGTDAATGEPA